MPAAAPASQGGCLGWRGRPNVEASAPKHTTNSQSFLSRVIVDVAIQPVRDILRCVASVADRAETVAVGGIACAGGLEVRHRRSDSAAYGGSAGKSAAPPP